MFAAQSKTGENDQVYTKPSADLERLYRLSFAGWSLDEEQEWCADLGRERVLYEMKGEGVSEPGRYVRVSVGAGGAHDQEFFGPGAGFVDGSGAPEHVSLPNQGWARF
jgi:hypothetical protein